MKKIALALCALSALSLSACGPDNVKACKELYTKLQGLECLDDTTKESFNPDTNCPDTLNAGGVPNYAEYYQCLEDGYSCDGDTFVADVDHCTIPTA